MKISTRINVFLILFYISFSFFYSVDNFEKLKKKEGENELKKL